MAVTKMKLPPLRDPAETPIPVLGDDPKYKAAVADLAALEQRYAESERRMKIAEARNRGQRPTSSMADRAKALVAGGTILATSPDAELAAAQEELNILRTAIGTKREELAAIVGALSYDLCKKLAPLNADCLRQALAATEALHTALHAAAVLRSRITQGGYELNATALPTHWFPAGAALGDPDLVGTTPAALFKAWLIEKGIAS